jgi:hypothetical protein
MELARLAASEQDSKELMKLVDEINELLEKKESRLLKQQPPPKPSSC